MSAQHIIMNFIPPSYDDIQTIARGVLDRLPEELEEVCDDIEINVEDVVDEVVEQEMNLDDPYDLIILFKSSKDIAPGVELKKEDTSGTLAIYRKPLLETWCEEDDELYILMRTLIIEELCRVFEFSDEDIDDMCARTY